MSVPLCHLCGCKDPEFYENNPDYIWLRINDKSHYLCYMCSDDLYEVYMHGQYYIKGLENTNGLPFYNWIAQNIKEGILTLTAYEASVKIQRAFRKHYLRKQVNVFNEILPLELLEHIASFV